MTRITRILSCIGVFLVAGLSTAKMGLCAQQSDILGPVAVVELFTSEGCSSCPPADKILKEWTDKSREDPRIFTLGFHVDYWDGLGWPDRFSNPQFTTRQRTYARIKGERQVYTPQMIVNGEHAFGGYRRDLLGQHVAQALTEPSQAKITLQAVHASPGKVTVNYSVHGPAAGHLLQIAVVENDLRNEVTRGENRGKNLLHANVVRAFQSVDLASRQGSVVVSLPEDFRSSNATVMCYLQDPETWRIIAAARAGL